MPIEWLGLAKFAQSGLVGAKSVFDQIVGKRPRLNFEPGDNGVRLRVHNPRSETIIIDSIEATPRLLGFPAGHELGDIVRAVVSQQQVPNEHALAVVPPTEEASLPVMTFDPFGTTAPDLIIKIRLHWRSATRGMFSKSTAIRKISVRDIRDLQWAADRNQRKIK
jgi:hypothetical protein